MREITRDIVMAMIFSKDGKLFLGMKDPKGGGVYNFWQNTPTLASVGDECQPVA